MTIQLSIIARPYATAAFKCALNKKALPAWEVFLKAAALIADDPSLPRFLQDPKITKQQQGDLFCDVLSSQLGLLDTERKNFIFLLTEKKRLPALPDIAELFSRLRAQYEKNISVQVISAAPIDQQHQQKFAAALTARLQQQIVLQYEIDPELLGGAIIRAGDIVLDGSVRGKLNRLIESL